MVDDYERQAERADRIEVARTRLLADRGALLLTAREYAKKRYFDNGAHNMATSIVGKHDAYGSLTERQWHALAGIVAYVDVKDEEDES